MFVCMQTCHEFMIQAYTYITLYIIEWNNVNMMLNDSTMWNVDSVVNLQCGFCGRPI